MRTLTASILFRETWPQHGAKHAARAAGCSIDTAKRWMRGAQEPPFSTVLRMAVESQKLHTALMRELGETDATICKSLAHSDVAAPAGSVVRSGRKQARPAALAPLALKAC